MRKVRRFIALAAVVLVAAVGVTSAQADENNMPGPGYYGELCSVGAFTFHGLDNNIHPGEIGLTTTLGCNTVLDALIGHQWLLNANGNGGWNSINETYAQKGKQNVLAISMTSWYKCGSKDIYASNYIQAKASWDMNFSTGFNTYGSYATNHWTKCYFPAIVSFN